MKIILNKKYLIFDYEFDLADRSYSLNLASGTISPPNAYSNFLNFLQRQMSAEIIISNMLEEICSIINNHKTKYSLNNFINIFRREPSFYFLFNTTINLLDRAEISYDYKHSGNFPLTSAYKLSLNKKQEKAIAEYVKRKNDELIIENIIR